MLFTVGAYINLVQFEDKKNDSNLFFGEKKQNISMMSDYFNGYYWKKYKILN